MEKQRIKKETKKELLESGKYQKYKEQDKKAFRKGIKEELNQIGTIYDFLNDEIINIEDFYGMSKEEIENCKKINDARRKQTSKIKKHINYLLNDDNLIVFFLTLTFDDKALELKPSTRKKYITRILNNFADYILNIDYGKENEREHYHAVIAVKKNSKDIYKIRENGHIHTKSHTLDKYNMGYYDIKKIGTKEDDKTKVAKYITKLTLHSVKVNQTYVSDKKDSEWQKEQRKEKEKNKKLQGKAMFRKEKDDIELNEKQKHMQKINKYDNEYKKIINKEKKETNKKPIKEIIWGFETNPYTLEKYLIIREVRYKNDEKRQNKANDFWEDLEKNRT